MHQRYEGLVRVVAVSLMLVTACAAPQPSTSERGASGSGGEGQPRAAKVLNWGIQTEPTDVTALSGLGGTRGPTSAFRKLAQAQLVKDDYTISPFPELAVELPAADKGTWKVNPDGTMQTIWKLRPNIKWHDGAPFTAEDLVFWLTVLKDDAFPGTSQLGLDQISSVGAPDPQTFVMNWSSPHYRANRIPEYGPIPKHILEGVYLQRDPEALLTHRYFTTEYVGLGPYRLAGWEPGSRIDFTRFDDYFGGRPPLDRVILRIIPDANTMMANALAGTIDVGNPPAENMDAALQLKRSWDGTGNRVRTDANDKMRLIYMQYRSEYAKPRDGVTNKTARQGLYSGIDRAAMAEVITEGLSPTSDSWFSPTNPQRPMVEASIPKFPFDVARAQRLLTEAGWVRGSDGVLVNQATGDRFDLDVRNRPGSATERELVVVADYWKALGVAPTVSPGTPVLVSDRVWLATYSGVQISRLETEDAFNTRRTHTRTIAAPDNRWAGRNGAGYSNPVADALQDRLIVTIDRQEQVNLQRQLLQEMMGEVAFMPLFWDTELVLVTKSVKADVSAVETGWNVATWDKEN